MNRQIIAVIGGGPAGLMAAEALAATGLAVAVYDAMATPGRKLLMAGRGGLNLTHSEPLDGFTRRYGAQADRFAGYLARFSPDDLRAWAQGLGIETFVGSSGRVFPRGMKASPLLRAWLNRLAALGVTLHTRHRWLGFADDADGGLALRLSTPEGTPIVIRPAAAVLALGGASWPRLGSDAAWVPWLTGRGVAVTPLTAANCGFTVAWSDLFRDRNEGLPLKNIAVRFGDETVRGDLVVTRYGLEGGPLYALGPRLRAALAADHAAQMTLDLPAQITLDLRPQLTAATLQQRLSRPRGAASWSTWLRKSLDLAPPLPGLLREASAPADLDRPDRLAAAIKALPVTLPAAQPLDRAISTAGGVDFAAVTDDLMLRAVPGCFVCGEMLDWEAPTGGYLLQGCFSTAQWAADGVLRYCAATAPACHV